MTVPAAAPITPIDLPSGTASVLLVGGTFDPPHRTHAQMALAAREFLDSLRGEPRAVAPPAFIAFVPAARSPFKPPPIAPDRLRIEMVRAMAGEIPGSGVWTDEIDRAARAPAAPSYWVDTLERAHAAVVAALSTGGRDGVLPCLHFLIGADQAIALHRWRSIRRMLELASPVIVLRPPVNTRGTLHAALLEARFWGEGEIDELLSRIAPADLNPASSTAIRGALATLPPTASPDLPPAVAAVLRRTNPYATE